MPNQDVRPRVVLAGNIACGKTTIARVLATGMGYDLIEESVGDNPYLERFYADMPRWAFHLNMYFLSSRAQALIDARPESPGAVFDRSFYEDLLFVDLARADGVTPEDNFAVFRGLYDTLSFLLPRPSLLVYLETPTELLYDRIQQRGRAFEAGLTVQYLDRIQALYDQWIGNYALSPVLRVDTSQRDFRADSSARSSLLARVEGALAAGHPQ